MLYEPSVHDLVRATVEEYYSEHNEHIGLDFESELVIDDECPSWIKEQMDDDTPF